MNKKEVLKIIDEVMNNREIDSIRNAILAIRDKVIDAPDERGQEAQWVENIRHKNYVVCSNCGFGLQTGQNDGDCVYGLTDCNRVSDERETANYIEDVANYCLFCGAKMKEDKEPQWVRYEKSDIKDFGKYFNDVMKNCFVEEGEE